MPGEDSVKVAILGERIDGHEKVCAERYGNIEKSFDRVHGRLDWIMRGIIGLLLAIVGWIVANGLPWGG